MSGKLESNESTAEACSTANLTAAQRSRIERNRAKAQSLRQAKVVAHPYSKNAESTKSDAPVIKVQGTKYIDSGGGFLIEQPAVAQNGDSQNTVTVAAKIDTANDAINIPVQFEECLDCGDQFVDSYLKNNFEYLVCDTCRDSDGRHSLITRTEAKTQYLLKDCDLDRREPILRFISRKNPHNVRWGEMKLYLHLQIEKRAMEVWGSMEKLEEQLELRDEKRNVAKLRKYNKNMKQLRMEMRSSVYTKVTAATHVHEFGEDTYNEEEDTYTHSCTKCPYTETYGKL